MVAPGGDHLLSEENRSERKKNNGGKRREQSDQKGGEKGAWGKKNSVVRCLQRKRGNHCPKGIFSYSGDLTSAPSRPGRIEPGEGKFSKRRNPVNTELRSSQGLRGSKVRLLNRQESEPAQATKVEGGDTAQGIGR